MSFKDIFKKKEVKVETKDQRVSKIPVNYNNGGFSSDQNLDEIFAGTDHGFDLAAGSYNKQINTVARLVGVPIVEDGDGVFGWLQQVLCDEAQIINTRAIVNGTHWILPHIGNLLEHIKDSTIGSGGIRINLATGKLEAVYAHEIVKYPVGDFYPMETNVERYRKWTYDEITEQLIGALNQVERRRNTFRIMPIPFAFNSYGEIRGNSAYSGVLRLLRDVHEIRKNRDSLLAQNKPTAIFSGDFDWDDFAQNMAVLNGQTGGFNPLGAVAIKLEAGVTYDLKTLQGITADYNVAIEDNNKEILTASMLPEMFSGKALVGNYASAEYNIVQGIEFIESVRREFQKAYTKLAGDMTKLYNAENYADLPPPVIVWDNFEMTSQLTRSQILMNLVSAAAQVSSGGVPVELAFDLIRQLNPMIPYKTAGELADAILRLKADTPPADPMEQWGL